MKNDSVSIDPQVLSLRQFIKPSGAAVVTGALAANELIVPNVHPAGSDVLRVGLIGCGGRGTGAAGQALAADPNVKLVAMGDAFMDRLKGSLPPLKEQKEIAHKID